MDELLRLVNLIVERSPKSFPLINYQDEKSLETRFFNLLKQGEVATDEDASETLYGGKGLSVNYRMLKSRLRRKLLNHLHFLEFPAHKFSLGSFEQYKIHALLLEAEGLIVANEYKLADRILTQAIAFAKEHHLTTSIVRALEQKLNIHTTVINKKTYLESHKELQGYYRLEALERTATGLFNHARIELGSSLGARLAYMRNLPEVLKELYTLWESSKSPLIYNRYHILSIQYLELLGDFNAISEAVANAEDLLRQGKLHANWFNHKYNAFIRIYALLRTRQYEKGLSLAPAYLQLFDPQTVNWFAFMENYLLLALHAQRYALAGELLQKSVGNRFFRKIQQPAKERWELYRKYLVLMSDVLPESLRIELPEDVFIELVTLPKDKAGYNLSLLVLDTIKSFTTKKIDDYESHAERIKKYILKYMRGDKAERPKILLRLLLLAIKKGLDFNQIREASGHLSEKLAKAPPPGDAFAEVEIVPYEHLWEAVLIILKRRAIPA
ncbi:hypothetical protein GCM10023188_30060 [Pontibacter saemangeumensis]|uniref:Uncharacterized protein n=1 Tax=Pontibacter saemangeumensis TaxID=1084525 RepID=A0ABP8LVQ5_9BACT